MELSAVTYAASGGIGRVVLNRPAQLKTKSDSANRTVKALVHRALALDRASGLELEIRRAASHMRSAEAAEGLAAFAEKRPPVFRPASG